MRWFAEVPTLDGRWSPRVFRGERPTNKTADGKQIRFSQDPILLPEEDYGLSLNELQRKYGSNTVPEVTEGDLVVDDGAQDADKYRDEIDHEDLDVEYEEKTDEGDIPSGWTVQELANHFEDGLATLLTVLGELPDSQAKNNTIIFMDTATLWAQQAFQMEETRRKNVKARLMRKRK